MDWTDNQVNSVFESQIRLQKMKWIFLSILLFLGLVAIVLAILCGCKYHRLKSAGVAAGAEPDEAEAMIASLESKEPESSERKERWSINDQRPEVGGADQGVHDDEGSDSEAEFERSAPSM